MTKERSMNEKKLGTIQKIYCNTCKIETNHELHALHKRFNELVHSKDHIDEYTGFEDEWESRFWTCKGCDTGTLEVAYTNTGMLDIKARFNVWESTFYPERERRHRPTKKFRQLNEKLTRIHQEMIESFNKDLRILCAIGLRSLLEGVCADKGVTGKNLQKRIDGLETHLPTNIVENLHNFRFIGNEAAHELQAPSRSELELAIEVIEDLLNFLYELDYKARRLSEERNHS